MDTNTCYLGTLGLRDLALYSHMVPAIASLVLGIFALVYAVDRRKAQAFFAFTASFAVWLIADLVNWETNDYTWVAATWAPLDFINIIFVICAFVFVYTDHYVDRMRPWLLTLLSAIVAVPLAITATGNSVYDFNLSQCEMIENAFLSEYKLIIVAGILLAVLAMGAGQLLSKSKPWAERVRGAFVAFAIVLFMGIFAGAEYYSAQTSIYEVTLYSLFGLPIFILALTYAITNRGSTFNFGDNAVKILFYVFLILGSTQFFYASSVMDFILTLISFGVIVTLGILLLRATQSEIASRHKVEELATDLQSSNERQEGLIHFISHEVKGALGKAVNVYSMTLEGDYGALPEKMQPLFTQGLHDTREAVDMVTAILLSSNLKSGQMKFDMKPFDMREATESVVNSLLPDAQRKGLTLSMHIPAGEYKINGDREIMTKHVIRNLVDNSIRYTPTGSVTVSVARRAGVIVLSVEDTGVGISDEDKARLFTEGGRGKESVKVNVNSTGYGLFFAKQLIDAHKGTVRAESDGPGKGSRFVVELPAL